MVKSVRTLHFSYTGRFRIFPPGADDHVIVLGPGRRVEGGFSSQGLDSPVHELDPLLVLRINRWLEEQSRDLPTYVRASFRSQEHLLSGWLIRALTVARQLESTLERLEAKHYVVAKLPDFYTILVISYLQAHGLPHSFRHGLGPLRTFGRRAGRFIRKGSRRVMRVLSSDSQDDEQPGGIGLPSELRGSLLVGAFQINATRAFVPVAHELQKLGHEPVFLLRAEDEASLDLLRGTGLHCRLIQRESLRVAATSEELVNGLVEPLSLARMSELFAAVGFPDWVSYEAMHEFLYPVLRRRLYECYDDAVAIDQQIEAHAPKGVVYITRRGMMDELLRARRASVKRVFYLQGIVPEIPPVFTPLDVDLALVGSRLDVSYADRCGIPEEKRRVCGYADYDGYPAISRAEAQHELERAFPRAAGRPFVIFTSQYKTDIFPDWARKMNLETVLDCARKSPDHFFVIKPHPLKEEISESVLQSASENVSFSKEFPTTTAIAGASVAVTYWSTTALEAVLLGTPLVQLNATGLPDFLNISERLHLQVARDSEGLRMLIQGALSKSEDFLQRRERFLGELGIQLDGKAATRVALEVSTLFAPSEGAERSA